MHSRFRLFGSLIQNYVLQSCIQTQVYYNQNNAYCDKQVMFNAFAFNIKMYMLQKTFFFFFWKTNAKLCTPKFYSDSRITNKLIQKSNITIL